MIRAVSLSSLNSAKFDAFKGGATRDVKLEVGILYVEDRKEGIVAIADLLPSSQFFRLARLTINFPIDEVKL